MGHQVETMAYTHEVPWHSLGVDTKAKTVKQWVKAAGLDWSVERRPMFYASQQFLDELLKSKGKAIKTSIDIKRHVEEFAALVRDKDGAVLDVVGPVYQPRQNIEVFEFFDEFVRAGKATMETAGSLRGGKVIWGLANLNASFKLKNNDTVRGYLLAVSYHQQGKANLFKCTPVRVVCANTLAMSLANGGGFKDYHSTKFDDSQIERAKEALGIARDQLHGFELSAKKLQSLKLKEPDVIRVVADVFDDLSDIDSPKAFKEMYVDVFDKRASKTVKDIMRLYTDAPGATPGDGWGALNAVTYWCDHVASRSADKRLTNAWLGKTSRQKELVLNNLLEMV